MTKSLYANRKTVGSIALAAMRINERIEAGDMAREFMPQLVDDINEAILANPFEGRPYYITVHEKKDLLLKNTILRRVIRTEYRSYPEPSTMVFYTNPQTQETLFCWSLPHTSEFPIYLNNPSKYHKDQIKDILAYEKERLEHFGFYKNKLILEDGKKIGEYYPIDGFKDRPLRKK